MCLFHFPNIQSDLYSERLCKTIIRACSPWNLKEHWSLMILNKKNPQVIRFALRWIPHTLLSCITPSSASENIKQIMKVDDRILQTINDVLEELTSNNNNKTPKLMQSEPIQLDENLPLEDCQRPWAKSLLQKPKGTMASGNSRIQGQEMQNKLIYLNSPEKMDRKSVSQTLIFSDLLKKLAISRMCIAYITYLLSLLNLTLLLNNILSWADLRGNDTHGLVGRMNVFCFCYWVQPPVSFPKAPPPSHCNLISPSLTPTSNTVKMVSGISSVGSGTCRNYYPLLWRLESSELYD